MYVFITILIIFICLLMMLVILVQNPKGGGLGAGFGGGGGGNMMGGVKQTTDFLDKATWTLIIALFVLSILTSAFLPDQRNSGDNGNETLIESINDNE
ncbi:MAG: preprotein translocase subunit SecG [Chitinophagales bacterium]